MRQLLDGQEYYVTKGDIIKERFDCEATVEQCMSYLHGISQLPSYTRYTGDRIILCTCLQLLPIENNAMLEAKIIMVDFLGMHFNANKALYINFQKHDSIFVRKC